MLNAGNLIPHGRARLRRAIIFNVETHLSSARRLALPMDSVSAMNKPRRAVPCQKNRVSSESICGKELV
jgi:hypothetical protein